MAWFTKRGPEGLVPGDVLLLLEPYGRAAFEARYRRPAVADPRFGWLDFMGKVSAAYHTNAAQTIAEIHEATVGNPFAVFGGYQAIVEVGPGTSRHPLFLEMMDAAINMIWEKKLSSGHLNRYEADRWIELHGDLRTSFDRIVEVQPPPASHTADLDLKPGQSQLIARTGPGPLDNQFFLECIDDVTYGVYSLRKWSSDSTTLTRCEETTIPKAGTAGEVLRSMGIYFQLPPYWAHDELKPYFTAYRDI